MKINFKSKNKGFTLVETLLYMVIISALMALMSVLIFILLQGKNKFQTISEVNEQGVQAMQVITQVIRNADSITLPVVGTGGASLTLAVNDDSKNPTIISSSGTNLQIKEGTGALSSLTNSRVVISNLMITNVSRNGTPGTVEVFFTISAVNPSGRNEYSFSQNFYSTTTIRN